MSARYTAMATLRVRSWWLGTKWQVEHIDSDDQEHFLILVLSRSLALTMETLHGTLSPVRTPADIDSTFSHCRPSIHYEYTMRIQQAYLRSRYLLSFLLYQSCDPSLLRNQRWSLHCPGAGPPRALLLGKESSNHNYHLCRIHLRIRST